MSSRTITVLGDVVLDADILGTVGRVAPDAPVPVVDVVDERMSPGGAGLAAVLCCSAHVEVVLVAPMADDAAGDRLRDLLRSHGVRLVPLGHVGSTRSKTRIRAGGQSLLRVDRGGPGGPRGPVPEEAVAAVRECDALLVSDYGAGTAQSPEIRRLLAAVAQSGHRGGRPRVCWDPHPRSAGPVPECTIVTPNLLEARTALNDPDADGGTAAAKLRWRWHAQSVAVTAGERGVWLAADAATPTYVPAPNVHDGDSCGAGDQFAASLTRGLARQAGVQECVEGAIGDAAAWVAAGGAAGFRDPGGGSPAARGSGAGPTARDVVLRTRARGGTVVATGGCFDILHAGHVATLRAARQLGDCLVVLLNSDASVSRLKGPERPVNPVADRVAVLEALDAVDAVIVFDDDDPRAAISSLRPDVWVKGGDYTDAELPEAELVRSWGGRVALVPCMAGRSTTRLLDAVP